MTDDKKVRQKGFEHGSLEFGRKPYGEENYVDTCCLKYSQVNIWIRSSAPRIAFFEGVKHDVSSGTRIPLSQVENGL